MNLKSSFEERVMDLQKNIMRLVSTSLLLMAVLTLPSTGSAQSTEGSSVLTSELVLPLFKSGILELQKSPSRVSVGNSAIADILILRSNQVHVLAKALGSTNVVFWDSQDSIFATVNIEVTHDLAVLKQKIYQMMPAEDIRIYSAQENLILEGEVSSAANLNAAVKVAEGYLPECISSESSVTGVQGQEGESNADACSKAEVVNLLNVVGSQQIMLEVKVAEIARTLRRTIDPTLNFLDISGDTTAGVISGAATLTPGGLIEQSQTSLQSGFFLSDLIGNQPFRATLELSRSRGLAKILAEPNLTTLTGRPAEFLSGGEFPVPVSNEDGISIDFREFGVSVEFLPTLLDNNHISLDLDIRVSDISTQNSVDISIPGTETNFIVPSLSVRSISNTVELSNGQTIGIAGLIQDNLTEVFTSLPGLGEIPVLGNLFRSQDFINGQTELVIFVTPHLAKPISPDKIKLPTDSFVPPSDLEFYLLGRMESLKDPEPVNRRRGIDGGFDGVTFGHDL